MKLRTRWIMWCCKTERRAKLTGLVFGALGGFFYVFLVVVPAIKEMEQVQGGQAKEVE